MNQEVGVLNGKWRIYKCKIEKLLALQLYI